MAQDSKITEAYTCGMYVRVPLETDRIDGNFRDFSLGQIQHIDNIAHTAHIRFYGLPSDELNEITCSLNDVDRCVILPYSRFTIMQTNERGTILYPCHTSWIAGQSLEYYVQIEGSPGVTCKGENELCVAANRQDYHPYLQMHHYEFQNPVWKFPRDRVVESCSELQNSVFGLEDLIGTRLILLSHQAEVITRVLADTTCRYILADEVGLGKTIEACVILKGLKRRNPHLRALLIVPSALAHQWYKELNNKFWLDFPIIQSAHQLSSKSLQNGCIVCTEDLSVDNILWESIIQQQWDVLVVDEAHHLHKSLTLYNRMIQLSKIVERVLVLSATPIQRYAHEYLSLLAIMDPYRYDPNDTIAFDNLLQAQSKIRRNTTLLAGMLKKDSFDVDDFLDDFEPIIKVLRHDHELVILIQTIEEQANSRDHGLSAAHDALAYISENYRMERRVIRNRRVHLGDLLPRRKLDTICGYSPSEEEAATLDALYDYIAAYLQAYASYPVCVEYCRLLMHAVASSPYALLDILETRIAYVVTSKRTTTTPTKNVLLPAAPRQEASRIETLIETVLVLEDENMQFLDPLLQYTQRWWETTTNVLEQTSQRPEPSREICHRLIQILNSIHEVISTNATNKVIVFSSWEQTLEVLFPILEKRYGKDVVTQFTCSCTDDQLQENADTFQSKPRCRILLCDELGGEGRNFQIADAIIHIDLPWTPAIVEQRIGRVDRVGRTGIVRSIVTFAQDYPEEALFKIWQDAFQIFTHSISGMEIALEGIQNELFTAIKNDVRHGLSQLLDEMIIKAAKLHEEVKEERYYEELSLNETLRQNFDQLADKYRTGNWLRASCLRWANLVGIHSEYSEKSDIVMFKPRDFSLNSMKKAHFLQLPNMEEALRRSGRRNNLVVRGTFNRNIAIRHEELVFFAPGSDPWLDAIIANATEADRGRCCAISRMIPGLKDTWRGFELLYTISLDPRPLYCLGHDPSHLFRAFGFLSAPAQRFLISEQGQLEDKGSLPWKYTQPHFQKAKDVHLGKRDGDNSQIEAFKRQYPADEWQIITQRILDVAEKELVDQLDDYMEDIASEMQVIFDKQASGLRATYIWQKQYTDRPFFLMEEEIETYKSISTALVAGLLRPIRRLESICYWELRGGNDE